MQHYQPFCCTFNTHHYHKLLKEDPSSSTIFGHRLFLLLLSCLCSCWLTCAVTPAHAEKRVALVVGNGAYRHADRLDNPVNDARAMRDALKSPALGFEVVYGEDLDHAGLRRAIGQFAGIVSGADVAIVYFAGHGATFGDTPYVVPVDAEFGNLDQVPYELVAMETLIGELRRAKGVRIAILDACRDDTAESRLKRARGEATRGLGPMKNPDGLILAYATQYLSTAADGGGSGHSAFTAALLRNIATPGLDVKDVFFNVGRDVVTATGGRQRPEISVSIYERYALVPPAAEPGVTAAVSAQPGPGAAGSEAERAWAMIQNTTSLAALDDYIRRFGDAPIYGPLARARREELAREPAKPAGGQQTAAVVAPTVTPVEPAADPCGGPVMASLPPRCAAALTAAQERGLKRGDVFRECENCPEMVVLPAGSFTMGSPDTEEGRSDNEGPQHVVTISKPFAVGKLHVTVDQFKAFVDATRYAASTTCFRLTGGGVGAWHNPGFAQDGSHPVVCVSWNDAKAYVDWLAKKTGKPYRLLSEAEWEYAARGQTAPDPYPRFWFGNDEKELCKYGNGYNKAGGAISPLPCNDGYDYTSPAGHYMPNTFGLHDMFGNALQWTADCYHNSYDGAPSDGSVWTGVMCTIGLGNHVVRGGSWSGDPASLRAAARSEFATTSDFIGFRVARTLNP